MQESSRPIIRIAAAGRNAGPRNDGRRKCACSSDCTRARYTAHLRCKSTGGKSSFKARSIRSGILIES
eukprot:7790596-Pyramimonas_sp.AAC.1